VVGTLETIRSTYISVQVKGQDDEVRPVRVNLAEHVIVEKDGDPFKSLSSLRKGDSVKVYTIEIDGAEYAEYIWAKSPASPTQPTQPPQGTLDKPVVTATASDDGEGQVTIDFGDAVRVLEGAVFLVDGEKVSVKADVYPEGKITIKVSLTPGKEVTVSIWANSVEDMNRNTNERFTVTVTVKAE